MPSGSFGEFAGEAKFATLQIGDESNPGTEFDRVRLATVAVNPASLAAVSTSETDVTIAGVAVGDFVVAMPPALEAGLVYGGCRVSAADTVKVRLGNVTAGAVDAASANWIFLIFQAA